VATKAGITLETKIADILNNYEGMKDILIDINPKFKKLNNPILRRTIGRVATIKQAAVVGNMDAGELVNRLRSSVGQDPLDASDSVVEEISMTTPIWVESEPAQTIDANVMLDDDLNPLAESNKILNKMSTNEILLIKSDFRPEPLIDHFLERGDEVYVVEISDSSYQTLIKKSS